MFMIFGCGRIIEKITRSQSITCKNCHKQAPDGNLFFSSALIIFLPKQL